MGKRERGSGPGSDPEPTTDILDQTRSGLEATNSASGSLFLLFHGSRSLCLFHRLVET